MKTCASCRWMVNTTPWLIRPFLSKNLQLQCSNPVVAPPRLIDGKDDYKFCEIQRMPGDLPGYCDAAGKFWEPRT